MAAKASPIWAIFFGGGNVIRYPDTTDSDWPVLFPDPELELAPVFSRPLQGGREIEHVGLLTLEVVDDRVYVCGELDADSGSRLRERLVELGTVPGTAIDLDLSEVTFIDSGGLHALTRLCESSAMVRVVAISDRVKRLLAVAGLTEIVLGSVITGSDA